MADHLHITCQDVVDLVSDYLERALPAGDVSLFEQHLAMCDGCVTYVDQLQRTIETVGHVQEEVSPETREQLMSVFRSWSRE